jgi:hypothetical protein
MSLHAAAAVTTIRRAVARVWIIPGAAETAAVRLAAAFGDEEIRPKGAAHRISGPPQLAASFILQVRKAFGAHRFTQFLDKPTKCRSRTPISSNADLF